MPPFLLPVRRNEKSAKKVELNGLLVQMHFSSFNTENYAGRVCKYDFDNQVFKLYLFSFV